MLPPLPAPAAPPPGAQFCRAVGSGKRLLQSWMLRENESSSKRACSVGTVALMLVKELRIEDGVKEKGVVAVYHLTRDTRCTGRCIGILPALETFALALVGGCREITPPLTALMVTTASLPRPQVEIATRTAGNRTTHARGEGAADQGVRACFPLWQRFDPWGTKLCRRRSKGIAE